MVRNNPGLHSLEITSPFSDQSSVGLEFRIKVNCYNVEGSTYSDTASIILAEIADAPTNPVRKVQSLSSTTSLAVEFDELAPEQLNGLPVLSYSLEIDYDLTGDFEPLIGSSENQLGLTYTVSGLTKSSTYGFRYRSRNLYGWSEYSPISYLLVATEPGRAARPTFISADNENILVDLNLNTQNRGSDITRHELAVSTDGLTYTSLISYDGVSSSYSLNRLIDGLTSG